MPERYEDDRDNDSPDDDLGLDPEEDGCACGGQIDEGGHCADCDTYHA